MASAQTHLLEVDPDLARFLSEEDQEEARRLQVPVIELDRGPVEAEQLLTSHNAFGAIILDGIILERMRLGNHLTMKLFADGDMLSRSGSPSEVLISDWSLSSTRGTCLAILGHDWLLAVRRWPALDAGLQTRGVEQAERLGVQVAICQLPRVEDRLMALLWWLAERWGRVTPVGTIVPLSLTHDIFGALVGARRPTVTLALNQLSERGAIVRQDQGWMLLEPPPAPDRAVTDIDDPRLYDAGSGEWRVEPVSAHPEADQSALLAEIRRLRAEHTRSVSDVRERLERLSHVREEITTRREARKANGRHLRDR
jgi:CRP/FNR family transcriptional regulator, cyclic AMP receptor protein